MRQAGGQFLILLILALVAGGLTWALHPHAPDYAADRLERGEMTVEHVLGLRDPVLWVDARSQAHYEEGHFPGALLLNEDAWEAGFGALVEVWQPEQTIIVYCDALECRASRDVAARLREELGAENVYHLRGGWPELQRHPELQP